jgi:hypothetical protein
MRWPLRHAAALLGDHFISLKKEKKASATKYKTQMFYALIIGGRVCKNISVRST